MKQLTKATRWLVLVGIIIGIIGLFQYFQSNFNSRSTITTPPPNWRKYTDPYAGFSVYYPSRDGVGGEDPIPKKVSPTRYPSKEFFLSYSRQFSNVVIRSFDNSNQLPLSQAILSKEAWFTSSKPTEYEEWVKQDLDLNINYIKVAGKEALQLNQTEDALPLVFICQHTIYISHETRVIAITLCPHSAWAMPLGYEASPEVEDIFWKVVNTMEFFSPTVEKE